jgi:hypothetical protein
MNYLRSYQFLFDSPKWLTNLLAGAVAMLVPIVGQMVFCGYQFEILERMHLRGEENYPDFDTDRLGHYLTRGIWPFLVDFVVRLIFGMLLIPVVIVMMVFLSVGLADKNQAPGVVFAVFFCVIALASLVVHLVLPLVLVPVFLRAGLTQDFGAAFSLEFIKDFVGKVWLELVLVQLFFIVTAPILGFMGLLACFIGTYPAAALIGFAHAYLLHQLYELYLKRGGTEIPLKAEPTRY